MTAQVCSHPDCIISQRVAIVDALIDEEGRLHCWCIHCGCYHHHGRGEGHRIAHCILDGSPFKRTSYYLRAVGRWTETHRRQAPAWERAAWRRQQQLEMRR